MLIPFLADEVSWFMELSKGATGVALGMLISGVGFLYVLIKILVPVIREMNTALDRLARSVAALVLGNENQTRNSQADARKVIDELDAKDKRAP